MDDQLQIFMLLGVISIHRIPIQSHSDSVESLEPLLKDSKESGSLVESVPTVLPLRLTLDMSIRENNIYFAIQIERSKVGFCLFVCPSAHFTAQTSAYFEDIFCNYQENN